MTTTAEPRVIELETIHNLRDLGGYPTVDGRVTRWRRLFRSDGLNRLARTDAPGVRADTDRLRGLGLRTVLDLRSPGELAERGRFPVEAVPVYFHHLPMIDVLWDPAAAPAADGDVAGFLLGQYREMLATGDLRVAEAFHHLAVPAALPAVFHCAAGKDRTGILAALVLAALGVPDEHVVDDYALTADAMARTLAWAERTDPELAAAFRSQPAAHLAASPAAMAGLLDEVRAEHGTVRDYVRSIGVTNAVLFRLEDELLAPAGALAA